MKVLAYCARCGRDGIGISEAGHRARGCHPPRPWPFLRPPPAWWAYQWRLRLFLAERAPADEAFLIHLRLIEELHALELELAA